MDSLIREHLKKENTDKIEDLPARLRNAEQENKWGSDEEACLGFKVVSSRLYPTNPMIG